MARWFSASELEGAELVWLLDLVFAGRTHKVASRPVTVDGEPYLSGLSDVSYTDELEIYQAASWELPTAELSVIIPDVARLISEGHSLHGSTATLSLYIIGSDSDDRRVVIEGRALASAYGGEGEAVSVSIEPAWLDASLTYPPRLNTVTFTAWTPPSDHSQGEAYPVIIGRPLSSPALLIKDSIAFVNDGLCVVAGHRIKATSLTVIGSAHPTPIVAPVIYRTDNNGIECACVEVPASWGNTQKVFVQWSGSAGGLPNPYGFGDLRSAGDVIRWALNLSGLKVDEGRLAPAVARLQEYKIDAAITEAVTVMDWLRDEILSLLPVSIVTGGDGVYLVVWDTQTNPIRAELTEGRDGITRESSVSYQSSEVSNEITLKYGYSAFYGNTRSQYTMTGDLSQDTDDIGTTDYLQDSVRIHGIRALELDAGDMINDTATAEKIVGVIASTSSRKLRQIAYGAPVDLAWLNVGDVVSLTDSELYLTDVRATIIAIEWTEGALIFELLFI